MNCAHQMMRGNTYQYHLRSFPASVTIIISPITLPGLSFVSWMNSLQCVRKLFNPSEGNIEKSGSVMS